MTLWSFANKLQRTIGLECICLLHNHRVVTPSLEHGSSSVFQVKDKVCTSIWRIEDCFDILTVPFRIDAGSDRFNGKPYERMDSKLADCFAKDLASQITGALLTLSIQL
jgi:hypothetical protein